MISPESLNFLEKILRTPSPTGFEETLQRVVESEMRPFADEVRRDVHGNLIVIKNPNAPFRIMLAGHCDQIALIVNYIDAEGFLYVLPLGGWDPMHLVGQRVVIWTASGTVAGVLGKKPIHLLNEEERKKVPKIHELWIDIGATNKEDAEKVVSIGDAITVELEVRSLRNNLIASPALDDKAGVWVVMEALRRLDASRLSPEVGVAVVSTVAEEAGLRGARTSAYGIDPHIGIAVDVTFSTDCPTIEKKQNGEVKLGGGPVLARGPVMNTKLVSGMIAVARERSIPFQMVADVKTMSTDTGAIQMNRAGVATSLVSIPNRYMHSAVEVVSLDDIDNAAELIARYVESVNPQIDLIP
ncbi:MAG: M42 family metallopeptidase [Thermoguttaceae bacterium]